MRQFYGKYENKDMSNKIIVKRSQPWLEVT